MIEAIELALVDKDRVREVKEETKRKLRNGNETMKLRAEGMKYTLECLDLWENKEN